jgi:hypothetical protein
MDMVLLQSLAQNELNQYIRLFHLNTLGAGILLLFLLWMLRSDKKS